MSPGTVKPIRIFCFVCLASLFFCLIIWLSAAITVGLLQLAQHIDGSISAFLIDKGAERIMRRVLLLWLIIILVSSLKKFGWHGWKDCGWTYDDEQRHAPSRSSSFFRGIVFGVITLGSMAALTVFAGVHQIKVVPESAAQICGYIFLFGGSALVIALIEETICRGVLFRVFARAWNMRASAITISILFAAAHFIGPSDAAFYGNSFIAITFKASFSTLASVIPSSHIIIQFVNLALLGIVLCVFVMRTKTIWMGVGAHAAWVFIIKLHSRFTNLNPDIPCCIWIGKRNDFIDSPITAFILLALILLFLWNKKKPGYPVKIRGQIWRFRQSETKNMVLFLTAGENLFSNAEILKAYAGCRVSKQNGLVLKQYRPKSFIDKFRFAFRPLRGRRSFILSGALIELGLPTPPVLAWTARRRFGLLQSEAVLVEEIQNAEQLTSWLERKPEDAAARLKVMEAYGNLMALFHSRGYSNRDFKHENVMCSKETPWVLWVVDLDGVRKMPFISRHRAGKDLMRVGKSLAALGWNNKDEIAAFFRAYNSHVPRRLCRHAFPGQ